MLQFATEKILNSNKTRTRDFQDGNKVLKVSVSDGAACAYLARHEHSVGQTEALRDKLCKRSDINIDSCTAQGSDYHNEDSNFPEMKNVDLSENLEEVYQKRIYPENETGASLNPSCLKEEKKRKEKRGGKRHNYCKRTSSHDSPLPTAADNSGLMTIVSENNTSCLEPEGQRENLDQNEVPMSNLAPVDDEKRSEIYGVNLDSAIEKSCELGTSHLDSTFENCCELGKSSLDCTDMERNELQEQPYSSNNHNANCLSPSFLAEAYMEKLKLVFSQGRSIGFPKKKLLILDLNGLLADINDDYHNAHMADAKVEEN